MHCAIVSSCQEVFIFLIYAVVENSKDKIEFKFWFLLQVKHLETHDSWHEIRLGLFHSRPFQTAGVNNGIASNLISIYIKLHAKWFIHKSEANNKAKHWTSVERNFHKFSFSFWFVWLINCLRLLFLLEIKDFRTFFEVSNLKFWLETWKLLCFDWKLHWNVQL